ncbi:hypothetical protein GBA52_025030 [Prunus armeniaca]|nr:hypothetical protein GBA52_025030 [Prunus armeniaca]
MEKLANHLCSKSSMWLGKSLSDTCVLSTGTRKYLKPTVNGETGQPPVQSNRAGGLVGKSIPDTCVLSTSTHKYLKATVNGETCQPPAQSSQAGGWGNHAWRTSGVLHMYTKIFHGNQERGNWPTTFAIKSSKWQRKSLPNTSVLSTGTLKHLKPTVNRETGQSPVQLNRAGGLGNHSQKLVY